MDTSTTTSARFWVFWFGFFFGNDAQRDGVEGRRVGGCVWVCQDRNAVLWSSATTATRWMEETKRGAAGIEERKGNRKEIRIDPPKNKNHAQ